MFFIELEQRNFGRQRPTTSSKRAKETKTKEREGREIEREREG